MGAPITGSNEVCLVLMLQIKTHIDKTTHCSIILSAGNNSSKLNEYLSSLREINLPAHYELLIVTDQSLEISSGQLGQSLTSMRVLSFANRLSREEFFDKGALYAKGEYLLFARGFIKFDKQLLEESVRKFVASGDDMSVSTDENFLLARNPYYPSKKDLAGSGERVDIFYRDNIKFDDLSVNEKSHYKRYEYAKSIILPGKIVGDFACGSAYGSVMLSEKSYYVIGADINEKVIEQVNIRYKNRNNIEFVHANLLDLKYESIFDYIVSFETVEHLKECDVPKLFSVFSRALKPGGTLILSTPYMQEMSLEAINMGFHLTFYIDEAKVKSWLWTNSLVVCNA